MANVFSTTLSTTTLLRSFINNIVQFTNDSSSEAFKCQITVDNEPSFDITPNAQGVFYFNFKNIFKKLIQDFFEDSQSIDIDSADLTSIVKDYSSIHKEVSILFQTSLQNGSTETTSIIVNIIQSTSNFQDRKNQEIQVLDEFAILSKPENASNRTFREVYFEGYPFDIQAYKNTPGNVVITNRSNLDTVTLNLPNKVNRIFFCDGEKDIINENILSLAYGMNELEFDTTQLTTIFLERRLSDCGKYLKWKNSEGGFQYWLFEELTEEIRDIKDKGYISNDNQDLSNNNFIKNIGKDSFDSIRIGSINVDEFYRRKIESLADSPKVYLFIADQFSADDPQNWISVKVNNRSFQLSRPKNKIFDVSFELELPKRDNITL